MSLSFDKIFLDMDDLSVSEQRKLLKTAYITLEKIFNDSIDPNAKKQAENFFSEVKEAITWSK